MGTDQPDTVPLLGHADRAGRSVRLSRSLPGTTTDTWRALTEPGELPSWLGRVEGPPPGPDQRFAIWHDEDTRSEHLVTTWEPELLLELSWEFPGEAPSTVVFAVALRDGHTTLTVSHVDLDEPVGVAAGWHVHLDYLAAHLEGHDRPQSEFWDDYADLEDRYAADAL